MQLTQFYGLENSINLLLQLFSYIFNNVFLFYWYLKYGKKIDSF